MIKSYNGKSTDWQKVNEPRVFHSEIGYDRQGKIKCGAAASCDYADNDRKDYPFNGCYKAFRIMLYLMHNQLPGCFIHYVTPLLNFLLI